MKVGNEVLRVLDASQTEGNALRLTGQLDRKLYEQTNRVLEAAGGTWNRKAKAHLFEGDAADAIEQVLLSGKIATHQDFDYFPTPVSVVNRLIELAEIQPNIVILEPSAGTGNITRNLPRSVAVDAIEIRFAYAERIPVQSNLEVTVTDFLTVEPDPRYDRVVMNPPFRNQADIKHVMHALKFLKTGGKLVSVMSAGILFRENKLTKDFRQLLLDREAHVEDNSEGAFQESGTMVQTVNVVIDN